MSVVYNENDPYAAAWLRNLIAAGRIAPGDVDERSIVDVGDDDYRGYVQVHLFAGIGGWSLAARIAGWPDDRPLWTGSCPCQAVSSAARGRNVAPDLWPYWRNLIAAVRPRALFGEQVPRRWWADRVCTDLEALDYAVGAAILPAIVAGQDHARSRFYFVGHTDRHGEPGLRVDAEMARLPDGHSQRAGVVSSDGLPARMAVFSAFGNAIVPQVAAAVIAAYLDI